MGFLKLRPVHNYGSVVKMRKKIFVSMVVVALLLIGVMATSVLASNVNLARNTNVSNKLAATANSVTAESLGPVREISPATVTPKQVEKLPEIDVAEELEEIDGENLEVGYLKEMVPKTYEEADARICLRTRFLLYTHDGKHIMWGFVGNGYFVGLDNLGKRCWGIYGNGVFAGFYDGDFFWGKYRCGNWKAEGLFGENYAHGKYILFPTTNITPAITATNP
jgi:hypothetical protein